MKQGERERMGGGGWGGWGRQREESGKEGYLLSVDFKSVMFVGVSLFCWCLFSPHRVVGRIKCGVFSLVPGMQ